MRKKSTCCDAKGSFVPFDHVLYIKNRVLFVAVCSVKDIRAWNKTNVCSYMRICMRGCTPGFTTRRLAVFCIIAFGKCDIFRALV